MNAATMNLAQAIATTITSGIQAEVNSLREFADNRIGAREAGQRFVNRFLGELPVLVTGEFQVSYVDDRGEPGLKMESRNAALWLASLLTTIQIGHTSPQLLGRIMSDWAKDTLNVDWAIEKAQRTAGMYIHAMKEMEILSLDLTDVTEKRGKETVTYKVHALSERFRDMLNTEIEALRIDNSMKCRALVHKPNDWVSNTQGVGDRAGLRLIKGQSEEFVAPLVLEAVNKLQAVRYTLSPVALEIAADMIDNPHVFKCTKEDEMVLREALDVARRSSDVYLPVTMDARGRMYYRGGLLTPQGGDFCKAALQFADAMPLGERGAEALAIHTANVFGIKGSLEARIDWVESNMDTIIGLTDIMQLTKAFPKAEKCQALVAAAELRKLVAFVEAGFGDVSEFQSTLVCHQDGTCNGLQHMAAITKDLATATIVNCTPATATDTPKDAYGIVAEVARTCRVTMNNHVLELRERELEIMARFGRDMAKNPMMITSYGAGLATTIRNTEKYLAERGVEADGVKIGAAFRSAIEEATPAVRVLTNAIKERVQGAIAAGKTSISWEAADGFKARTEYRDSEAVRVRAGVFSAVRKDLEPVPDMVKTIGAATPNFIHSIDAAHLRAVVRACAHPLVAIHDCIGSHAGSFHATSQAIREQFVAVHQFNALETLCNDLGARTPKFRGEYDVTTAEQATYLFS